MSDWRDTIRPLDETETAGSTFPPVDTGVAPAEHAASWRDTIAPIGAVATAAPSPDAPSDAAPELGYGAQALKGLKQGLQSAALPFARDKEFYKGEHTGVETVAQILGDLATGKALATGAGATLGLLAPIPGGAAGGAMVGNVLYGLYSGIGEEYSRSKAEGQDFNVLRAAGNAALEVNPLVKAAAPLNAAIRAGMQALGTTAKEYSYTGDAKQAAWTGAISLAVAPFIYRGIRPEKLPTAETQKTVQDMLASDVGLDLVVKTEKRLQDAGEAAVKFSRADDVTPEFAEFYTGKQGAGAVAEFEKLLPKLSPTQLDATKEAFSRGKLFAEEAGDVAQKQADKLASGVYEGVGWVSKKMLDARYVGARMDRRLGTDVEGMFDNFSKAKDRFTQKAAAYLTQANKIAAAQRKLGVSNEDVGRALAGQRVSAEVEGKLNTVVGKTTFTDEAGKQHVQELTLKDSWRKVFDDLRGDVRKSGWNVGYVDNYVPRTALQGPDLAVAIKDQVTRLQGEALRTGAKSLLDLTSDEAKEFKTLASRLLNKPVDKLTSGDVAGLTQTVLDPSKTRNGFSSSAVFERVGDTLPEWSKEYDVGRLFTKYLNSNLKAAEFAEPFRQASNYVQGFRSAGLNNSADYIEHYMGDVAGAGSPKIFGGLWNGFANRTGVLGRELEKSGSPSLGKAVRAVPDFVSFLNTNVYPAYLGMNARAALRNMTQAWMTTAPELGGWIGGAWGQGTVTKAALQTARDVAKHGLDGVEKNLQARGLLGNFVGNETAMEKGFATTAQLGARKLSDAAMWAYGKTDVLNRAIAANTADMWADAIQKGDKAALAALDRLPTGFKVRIRVGGDQSADGMRDALADYLVGRTQFRYGKEQSFELGRDLGQAFSMFTKWPVMVASDVADTFDRNVHKSGKLSGSMQAVQRVGNKYLVPMAVLAGMQHLVADPDSKELPPGFAKYALGKDLKEISPILALKALDFSGGPAVSFGKDLVGAAVSGDTSKGRTILRRGIKSYLPVVSTVINELDRLQEAFEPGESSPSRKLVNTVTGKEE